MMRYRFLGDGKAFILQLKQEGNVSSKNREVSHDLYFMKISFSKYSIFLKRNLILLISIEIGFHHLAPPPLSSVQPVYSFSLLHCHVNSLFFCGYY